MRDASPSTSIGGILLVDDHPTLRAGLAQVASPLGIGVHGVANIGEALDVLRRGLRFRLIVYDWHAGPGSGVEGLETLRRQAPDTPIAVLTSNDESAIRETAERHGARAHILKSEATQAIQRTLARLLGDGGGLRGANGHDVDGDPTASPLSPRQHEVLQRIACGAGDKDIARALGISHNTVRGHVSDILAVLGAHNRTHAVLLAAGRGWIPPITPQQ